MADESRKTIYLVSDGTCRTCETVVRAVLVQFKDADVRIVQKPEVRRPETVVQVVEEAAQAGALLFYTLIYDKARAVMQEAAREHMVPSVDLLEPVMVSLYELFKSMPRAKPGILHKSSQQQFDRTDAVEYTLAHDDGHAPHELKDADVILVGVSRSGKSTTCFYLAYSGIRAANVPLFADAPPPEELRKTDPKRVIGLTMNPYRLQSVREARLRGWGMDLHDEYAHKLTIAKELRSANEQMERYGWRCIDASYKAVEEIAREVRQMLADAGFEAGVRDSK